MLPAISVRDVVKEHGGLRPLRLRNLEVSAGEVVALQGPDALQAAVIVDLLTGTALPGSGEVTIAGHNTRDIADQEAWLAFLDQFGILNDRVVLLDGLTVAQNLALPLTLSIDPIPEAVLERVTNLSVEVGLSEDVLGDRLAEATKATRALVRLARAVALDPAILLIEHPTTGLGPAEVGPLAKAIAGAAARRSLTVFVIGEDTAFIETVGARRLSWRPATGEVRGQGSLRRWLHR